MLAVVVTAYSNALRANVPAYGEANEFAWSEDTRVQFEELMGGANEALTEGATRSLTMPAAPRPQSVSIPLFGRAEPAPPSGVLSFRPSCVNASASHLVATTGSNTTIIDLQPAETGCIIMRASPIYSGSFSYHGEMGGVVRAQPDGNVVVRGPSLRADVVNENEHRISLTLPSFRGQANAHGIDRTGVRVDLVPGPASREVEQTPNAANATWVFKTAHPVAWRQWFDDALDEGGLVKNRSAPTAGQSNGDYAVTCLPASCARDTDGRGTVRVFVEGPRIDANDIRLSVTYGFVDVNLR